MKTPNKTKDTNPVENSLDGNQLDPSNEEFKAVTGEDKNEDLPDLDEDIMMYMINI